MPKRFFSHSQSGFSLIELMVVVAVLSVAAAILVPKFLKHQIEKKQTECHQNLQSLLEAERKYFEKENVFTTDLGVLNWQPQGKTWHQYRFLPPPSPKNGFLFECFGNIDKDAALDQAAVDETGRVHQVSDDTK